jgi:hypothetical protein
VVDEFTQKNPKIKSYDSFQPFEAGIAMQQLGVEAV